MVGTSSDVPERSRDGQRGTVMNIWRSIVNYIKERYNDDYDAKKNPKKQPFTKRLPCPDLRPHFSLKDGVLLRK